MIFLSINKSFTYPPYKNVTISNVKEIWFSNSYLPTFLHDVMKYPVFFFGRLPLNLTGKILTPPTPDTNLRLDYVVVGKIMQIFLFILYLLQMKK